MKGDGENCDDCIVYESPVTSADRAGYGSKPLIYQVYPINKNIRRIVDTRFTKNDVEVRQFSYFEDETEAGSLPRSI
jgi:hypothetical protein